MAGHAGRHGVFRDNRIFTTILVVLLIMHLIGDLVLGILSGLELIQLSTPEGEAHFHGDDLNALDMAMIFAGLGYLLMAVVTVTAVVTMLGVVAADVVYALVDPRIVPGRTRDGAQ